MGTQLKFNTTFQPANKRSIGNKLKILVDMLWACFLDFKGSWIQYFLLIEFTYSNSYQMAIGILLYKVLYGWNYRSPFYWNDVGYIQLLGHEMKCGLKSIGERHQQP
jgi:hypothetical protein